MNVIERIALKMRLKIYSFLHKINLPLTKKNMIDEKKVRHVYKIETNDIKLFYCMIQGKSYLLNYSEKLEEWLKLSEIEIKISQNTSEMVKSTKNIANVGNLKYYLGK